MSTLRTFRGNDDIKMLPSGLLTLDLFSNGNMDDDDLAHLPRTLTHLNLAMNKMITDKGIANLPRTLKIFILSANKIISNAGVAHLPPNLEILNFYDNRRIKSNAVASLPRSLTKLNLYANEWMTDECVPHLPPHLVSLNLASGTFSNSCPPFPHSLTRLNLLQYNSSFDLFERAFDFPPKLTALNIASVQLSDHLISTLPRTITKLNFDGNPLLTNDFGKFLPPAIVQVEIRSRMFISCRCLAHLPPTLIDLNLLHFAHILKGNGFYYIHSTYSNLGWIDLWTS